ncbi:MAG TPA: lipopolysaccharide biosynthesis protein RfbH [Candidatus Omnitrophica bacterium]|nr:MAG: lipopolysaccharide biosynthesis protein RfbH [Omnitrophica WOR_2 bacterium GWA2_45_18]OGX19883.1 MAG: lipopolysaccharide biosynthesis protein RfbH [Omnitrophica WOR_2 bacterium GWC2_45_7]HBR15949.1 lipopolysaccharide biosynthesis protein RfbH [Candidatus Omnitrophota bacterium]
MNQSQELRKIILDQVVAFHHASFREKKFVPGVTPIPVAGRVFDDEELVHLVDASLDFWLTTGRFADQFEAAFSRYLGARESVLCNSGSSANLLAVSALTSPELGTRRLVPGDEILTVAAGFPTTVTPIVQNRLVPVFVDIELPTYNVNSENLVKAITQRTKAIILAHTLGNPFVLDQVKEIADRHGLWLIEDNCDALGSVYKGKLTGTHGDLGTFSFYPAHHITMGEGGCVATNNVVLKKIVVSLRDWGRDCWCDPGKDNTCGKRFEQRSGGLPESYDHKYVYSHLGYNLKLTDMQAAVGLAQLKKLDKFIEIRKRNWRLLHQGLQSLQEFFILPEPTQESDPSWFGFLITIREKAPFSRAELIDHLEKHKIATRLLFGGNLTKQPAFKDVAFRVAGELTCTDLVMNQSFWIGVYPGISEEMIAYMLETIQFFIRQRARVNPIPNRGR